MCVKMVNLSKISEGGDGDEGPIKPVEDIIFTVDADIYEKTGVRKPKKGENKKVNRNGKKEKSKKGIG